MTGRATARGCGVEAGIDGIVVRERRRERAAVRRAAATVVRGGYGILRPSNPRVDRVWHLIEDFFEQSWVMKAFIGWSWLCVLIMALSLVDGLVPGLLR